MSVLPVPQDYVPHRTEAGKGSRGQLRPPRPWTAPDTGKTHTVAFDPESGTYQVGFSATATFRVPPEVYAELGGSAFYLCRQALELAEDNGGGDHDAWIFYAGGGQWSVQLVADNTWQITPW